MGPEDVDGYVEFDVTAHVGDLVKGAVASDGGAPARAVLETLTLMARQRYLAYVIMTGLNPS